MSSVDTSLPEEITSVTGRDDGDELSKDVIFELLKNRRRREVLAYLVEADDTVTLGELAEQIAAWENDTSVNALSSDQRKRVYVALYQTHLPKMDDAGIVDYDQDRGLITLSDNADLLMMYLERDEQSPKRWDLVYGLVSVAGTAALVAAIVGFPPATLVPLTALALGIVGLLLVVSSAHFVLARRRLESMDGKFSRIQ